MIHTDHLVWSANNPNTYEQHHIHPHHTPIDFNPGINAIAMSSPHDFSVTKSYPLDFTDVKASQSDHDLPADSAINSEAAADNSFLQTSEFQSFLEFNGKQNYQNLPENKQAQIINNNKQQFMDGLFNDIFQNYSMDQANSHNEIHDDVNNNTINNPDNREPTTVDELLDEKHDLFKSPYINSSNLIRSRSADTPETMGGNSTTDDYTPLLSPTTTTLFDTMNSNILSASEFAMPVSFFDGNSSPSLEALNNNNIPTDEAKAKRLRKPRKPSTVSKVSKAPSLMSRPSAPSRRLSVRLSNSATSSSSSNGSPVISTSVNRNYSSSMAQYSKSMSPEELHSESSESSAAEMPPPARSVAIGPLPAATPASLMNLPKQDIDMLDVNETESHLKDAVQATKNIAIQASVVAAPPTSHSSPAKKRMTRTSRTAPSSASSSPLIASIQSASARKKMTPTLAPHERSKSITSSIMIKPKVNISASPVLIASLRHSGGRNSISSSPNIMPKISPHMSPHMVPMGGNGSSNGGRSNNGNSSNDDLSALLASKSNYQNIVEGNHNQLGLLYPDTLSADLTSKRTSHKLAEQGRRNRINMALADLAKLLSPDANQAPSKATTVELAIKRINELKTELDGCKDRLRKYEEI